MTVSQSFVQLSCRWVILFVILVSIAILAKEYYRSSSSNLRFHHTSKDYFGLAVEVERKGVQAVHYWFFALDSQGEKLQFYAKQAVLSALYNTNLVPVVMLDGKNKALEEWFIHHNVTVLDPTQTEVVRYIQKNPTFLTNLGMSTWYRIGIPEMLKSLNFSSYPHIASALNQGKSLDYILYTDADILFVNKVVITEDMLPRFVSMSVQGNFWNGRSQNKYASHVHTNAGVMILNMSSMQETKDEFISHIELKLKNNNEDNANFNDQTAFHQFYPIKIRLSPLEYVDMYFNYRSYYDAQQSKYWANELPKIFEWEPYLGINENAAIIHWHGQKISIHSCKELNVDRLLNESSNCVLRTLVRYNATSHPQLHTLSPPSVEWFQEENWNQSVSSFPMGYELENKVHANSKNRCHITVPVTKSVISGYQYYTALFFDYMNKICPSS